MKKTFDLTRIYQFLIIALVLVLLWKWHCGSPACPPLVTTVTRDTVIKWKVDSSNWSKPSPVATTSKKPQPEIIYKDGRIDTVWGPVDTSRILEDYYLAREYDTTYTFIEGTVRVQNSVYKNELELQRVIPTFRELTITETITKAEKKRGQVYLGIEGYGGTKYPLYGAGGSLMYKSPRDRIYEVGGVAFKDQPVMFKLGAKFLLSFRK